ncbi:hypothetical protein ACFQ1R_11185 [Mariniflexile jejuense]|uniref:Uncharacterized protein n=1 Tax=Mariniflexile jejuense TaxID=1173582 RepID=A0ABW3JM89_9FLAO
MSIVLTGFFIAIRFFKTLKWKRFYFSIYPFGCTLFIIGYILKGMFGAIIMCVTMFPIVTDDLVYKNADVRIFTKYTGLFSRCCTYSVSEKKYVFFEKYYGEFTAEVQSSLTIKNLDNTSKILKITFEDYVYNKTLKDMVLKDSTLVFKK